MKMKRLMTIILIFSFIILQVTALATENVTLELNSNATIKFQTNETNISTQSTMTIKNEINTTATTTTKPSEIETFEQTSSSITTEQGINYTTSATPTSSSSSLSPIAPLNETETTPITTINTTTITPSSATSPASSSSTNLSPPTTEDISSISNNPYCSPSLCEFYNGTHTNIKPHIACKNSGNFSPACGTQPHLLKMSERRRNLILDLHNLARSRIASGQVNGYKSASRMPQLKWDNELEYLATLHVKRCRFEHDLCHNTQRYPYSGQNIGYFWKGANITSHSKRMKNFIVNWYKEHLDANQTFIDSFHLHPEQKVIGHFTAMVGDRVHHVGCAAIRFYESDLTKILMTCNYDYNNFAEEPVYQTGPPASKCAYKVSERFPGLCEWKVPMYDYEPEDSDPEHSGNLLFSE